MYFDVSQLHNFSYLDKDKDLIIKLLLLDGVGRRTIFKVLLHLKKHEIEYVKYLGIIKKNYNKKIPINRINNLELDDKIYSLKNQLKTDNIIMIFFWEKEYPELLKQTDDFPLVLFVKGNKDLLCSKMIAVVGTRQVTSYGMMVTQEIVKDLVKFNYTIVSGCMYGVDEVAHVQTLNSGGKTVAVLGYGFNKASPKNMMFLQEKILKNNGCLVSEYFPDTKASKSTFPQRNRIVAGMSLGVVVTEAAKKSGTHITAECAIEAGRDVFAVSGSIFNPYSMGTQYLINQGAKLVCSGRDVVAEFEKIITIPAS